MVRIGYLGPEGTFSHEALLKYAGGNLCAYSIHGYASIPDILYGVHNGEIDEAIVPIENSIEGAVSVTLDIIAADVDLKIKGEEVMNIKQNLMAKKGTKIEDIKQILSHPQPIGQCRKYINSCFPNAEVKCVYSTAGAANEVAMLGGGLAAIGSAAAAEAYGLDILAHNIQDGDNNSTRFIVVSRDDRERTGHDKTSIVFSTEDRPGSLYRILDIFNLWDINMTRIESRPAKNQLGRYIFFVDVVGHRSDEDVKDALTMIKKKTSFFKFLGSYPYSPG
ncbi:prephenate dehydratase [Anaerobacterium chartisolvens]|uniref:Prephenate dehydratase n=1 Tax=Anaerobacterium chartisolvens TaxID=1297424 RepID=A0A369BHJ1_9FIRM|nr:prephenate dehydratase [Anaerobacterium chartisolvens]RCX21032.1 prephenate dehydratase [Anaerobacterium chartisolvens]